MHENIQSDLANHTCASVLVSLFEQLNVAYVFGVPGGPLESLLNELEKSKKIHFVLTRHESGASYMAEGYARASANIGICISTTGR